MLTKRIIPCLDVKDGRTVKGTNFVNLRDAGDPVELATKYAEQQADELVFLDISATDEKRRTLHNLVHDVAEAIDIPFTVGGGISSEEDVYDLLMTGADKVSINSAAVRNPDLINELSAKFGSQCIVLAVDARFTNGQWLVHLNGGKVPTEIELMSWIKEGVDRGAGEILFTSMDHDGTKAGFANKELAEITDLVNVPIIASGGAGTMEHFRDTFIVGRSDAALAASVFHYHEIDIPDLKKLSEKRKYKREAMKPDFSKGLLPAIIQDSRSGKVLMQGYMNQEAFDKTQKDNRVTFYSRSKERLWTKGEKSKNYLNVESILLDCDSDSILIKAIPEGPVCHTGSDTCWDEKNDLSPIQFIEELEQVIQDRKNSETDASYTASLLKKGINKVAQKVGEEAVELVIEAKDSNRELFLNEAADLLYHYLVLLAAKDYQLEDVINVLKSRRK